MKEKMDLVAKTFQGLEDVLAGELVNIGAEDAEPGRRMGAFRGDKTILYNANFCCRTALRILKPFLTFKADDTDQLYEAAKQFEWDKLITPDQTFSIDSTVYSDTFRHSKFVTYRVKDAIADYFTEKYNRRPSIRLVNADLLLNVHIAGNDVIISLDSSGEPLYKRGYRVAQTDAPINEVLAAGLIMKAGWHGQCNLIDPMCGSGTFLIEAALIAANINPGIYRQSFAFEKWKDYEPEILDEIYNDDSQERDFEYTIYGSDISAKAIAISAKNIRSARAGRYIDLKVMPVQDYEEAPENGMLITNPPYGERLNDENLETLYEALGNRLKNVFKGYHAWVIGEKNEYFDKIGLKASQKIPVLNGAIECEFREYVIFGGRYDDFVKEGNRLKSKPEDDAKRKPADKEARRPREKSSFGERRPRRERDYERKPEWKNQDDRFPRRFKAKDDDRYERDRRGVRREKPKNALEEKYHKPYSERMRSEKPARRPEPVFDDAKVNRAVRFRKPRLFDESEIPQGEVTMRHRHKKEDEEITD